MQTVGLRARSVADRLGVGHRLTVCVTRTSQNDCKTSSIIRGQIPVTISASLDLLLESLRLKGAVLGGVRRLFCIPGSMHSTIKANQIFHFSFSISHFPLNWHAKANNQVTSNKWKMIYEKCHMENLSSNSCSLVAPKIVKMAD